MVVLSWDKWHSSLARPLGRARDECHLSKLRTTISKSTSYGTVFSHMFSYLLKTIDLLSHTGLFLLWPKFLWMQDSLTLYIPKNMSITEYNFEMNDRIEIKCINILAFFTYLCILFFYSAIKIWILSHFRNSLWRQNFWTSAKIF